jgi:hypothetical protein
MCVYQWHCLGFSLFTRGVSGMIVIQPHLARNMSTFLPRLHKEPLFVSSDRSLPTYSLRSVLATPAVNLIHWSNENVNTSVGYPLQPSADQKPVPSFPICHFLSVPLLRSSCFGELIWACWFVLALQIYLNLNALVFAIWNVGASRAAGVHGGFLGLEFALVLL